MAAALALHFLALLPANAHGLAFGLGQSLSTVMWLTVLIYWTPVFYKLDGLQTCLMPMAVLAWCWGWRCRRPIWPMIFTSRPCCCIAVSLLAYSLLLIAAILAVMMPGAGSGAARQALFASDSPDAAFAGAGAPAVSGAVGWFCPADADGVFRVLFF